jgi:hypothetical protein
MRGKILKSVRDHRFKAEEDAIADAFTALADETYAALLTKNDRAVIDSVPAGFLREVKSLFVYYGGMRHSARFSSEVRIPYFLDDDYSNDSGRRSFPGNHPLTTRFTKLSQARERLRRAREDARAKASSVLYSVATTAALVQAWPEVESFIPAAEVAPKNLPAVPMQELNCALGLAKPADCIKHRDSKGKKGEAA